MPTTTNNGWTTPADTALVKDGASAIRTLGNNIDSTLGVYASPALTLISTTTFTTSSSQSINSVFSATYKNYKLVYNGTKTLDNALIFRFRASGTDDSSANYNFGNSRSFAQTATYDIDRAGSSTSASFVSNNGANCFQK